MIDPVELHVYGFFKKHDPEGKGRWIVGVSGGADSTALLCAMADARLEIIAVHCNFGLRGAESDRDERFVKQMCRERSIPLIAVRFDTEKFRVEHGLSLETACRDLRYDFFRKTMERESARGIVVGHNRNDNAETMLMNLLRGTGIKGLRGMLSVANDIYRPLLAVSREEIENYLTSRKIEYITDSSNLTDDFTRNKIRNVIMPLIRREFPNADNGLETTRRIMEETEDFVDSKIADSVEPFFSNDWDSLKVDRLIEQSSNALFILYQFLSGKGLNKSQIINIYNNVLTKSTESKTYEADGCKFILDKGTLRIFERANEHDDPMKLFHVEIIERGPLSRLTQHLNEKTILIDGDAIDPERLTARYWRNGDYIVPFGMKGRKKLSDLFTDKKIAVDRKHNIPLLTYGDDIIWVAGVRRSDLFPVKDTTRRVIKVDYLG